jgi:8-oxo-dGTP diphosphatase
MGSASDRLPVEYPEIEVWAAGGVVWRRSDVGVEVLLAHRPAHRDWTFPKGKLDPGETLRQCARREVEEETGFVCSTGVRLPLVTYRDAQRRQKAVVYWAMTIDDGSFVPNREVDAVAWFDLASARATLSYRRDVDLLKEIESAIGSPTVRS